MFDKILIANRGEIACRVIESCRKLGVRSVAVYSEVDAHARHVALADEAVALGGQTPAQSYLRGDALIEAARSTGAEAIHPGYGFLSENPEFVEQVEAAGLIFIGPSADAIRSMGLKGAAKALMQKANVPVVPGYHGAAQDALSEEAEKIGYPVLIKAVAGGGGKGMRLVEDPAQFGEALEAAKSEALKAFGNDVVLIEKFVAKPRHIEFQVFGDGEKAVHLFERDCSLQRRHQKVIEEAPAPGMSAEMRSAMGAAAVRAAEAVGYAGAGTVEFIVDSSDGLRADRFYFMEMNTRLQVEHPVTEGITGIDLVEWQLRVAAGEPLPATQELIEINGHAFEARLYAEDVPAGFLPATGVLTHLSFPENARIDTSVVAQDEITTFYDPMIAKLTVHGPTREAALAKLQRALTQTQIAGVTTNLAFLGALARQKEFARGEVDTGLIERNLEELSAVPVPCSKCRAIAAVAGLYPIGGPWEGFSLWGALTQEVALRFEDEDILARVTCLGQGHYRVALDGVVHELRRDAAEWRVDGTKLPAQTVKQGAEISVFWGNTYVFQMSNPLDRDAASSDSSDTTNAPMPGLVKAVFVAAGDQVEEGDRLAILEAMKMEHVLRAGRAGRVASVAVSEGAQVAAGDTMVHLDPSDDG
ncbi:MAG: biotin carboxylase N-terminal domain-containing protein [Pseudomonadota bacterium]